MLELENNAFTFDDIRPNIQRIVFNGAPGARRYAPQDSAGKAQTIAGTVVEQLLTIALGFDKNEASSFYNWFKDGQPYKMVNGSPYLTFSPSCNPKTPGCIMPASPTPPGRPT